MQSLTQMQPWNPKNFHHRLNILGICLSMLHNVAIMPRSRSILEVQEIFPPAVIRLREMDVSTTKDLKTKENLMDFFVSETSDHRQS